MDKIWLLIKTAATIISMVLGLGLESCNETEKGTIHSYQDDEYDSIAYTVSNKKFKTLRVKGQKVYVLEQNNEIHIHGTKE